MVITIPIFLCQESWAISITAIIATWDIVISKITARPVLAVAHSVFPIPPVPPTELPFSALDVRDSSKVWSAIVDI